MDNLKLHGLSYQCCFCDEDMGDVCELAMLINIDKSIDEQRSQFFYCHLNCFRIRLSPKIQYYSADKSLSHTLVCCFCDENIKSNRVNPCDVILRININRSANEQHSQKFYFHAKCFGPLLQPTLRGYFIWAARDDHVCIKD